MVRLTRRRVGMLALGPVSASVVPYVSLGGDGRSAREEEVPTVPTVPTVTTVTTVTTRAVATAPTAVAAGVRLRVGADSGAPCPVVANAWSPPVVLGTFVGMAIAPDMTLALACADSKWAHRLLSSFFGAPAVLAYLSGTRCVVGYVVAVNGVNHLFVSFRVLSLGDSQSSHLPLRSLKTMADEGEVVFLCECFARFVSTELPNRIHGRRSATFALPLRNE